MKITKIIVGVDFSKQSIAAAHQAVGLAMHTAAEVVLVHASAVPAAAAKKSVLPTVQEWERIARWQADQDRVHLERLRAELAGRGVTVSKYAADGPAAEALASAATELDADLVVVGTHGRNAAARFLLGSVAQQTVRWVDRDVLVARPGPSGAGGFHRILVPTDFSHHSELAMARASELVAEGGEIDVVHFWQLPVSTEGAPSLGLESAAVGRLADEQMQQINRLGEQLLAAHKIERATMTFETVHADPAHGIVDRASSDPRCDLIVMGSHGHRGFRRFFLGSVAEKVVTHAPCSTVVTHARADRSAPADSPASAT